MLRHFHNPTASVNRLHRRYTSFWSGRVAIELADAFVGANGANPNTQCTKYKNDGGHMNVSLKTSCLCQLLRTGVDCSNVFEWCHEKHEHDPHTENLHTPAGHVQHKGLHRERFSGGDRKIPCALLFQARIRCLGGSRSFDWRSGLI
jgi:hypothetical protein